MFRETKKGWGEWLVPFRAGESGRARRGVAGLMLPASSEARVAMGCPQDCSQRLTLGRKGWGWRVEVPGLAEPPGGMSSNSWHLSPSAPFIAKSASFPGQILSCVPSLLKPVLLLGAGTEGWAQEDPGPEETEWFLRQGSPHLSHRPAVASYGPQDVDGTVLGISAWPVFLSDPGSPETVLFLFLYPQWIWGLFYDRDKV